MDNLSPWDVYKQVYSSNQNQENPFQNPPSVIFGTYGII
jgi:hypothetical protein